MEGATLSVKKAMEEWESKTCIRFNKRTTETSYVQFFRGTRYTSCKIKNSILLMQLGLDMRLFWFLFLIFLSSACVWFSQIKS